MPRLAELGGPLLVVLGGGLAWAAFHWPLMLLLGGAPDGVPVLWAVLNVHHRCHRAEAVLAWMRLRWGQWPGVVAHAVVNAIAHHLVATVGGEHSAWLTTESGLAAAVVAPAAAASGCGSRRCVGSLVARWHCPVAGLENPS